jgi:hypothetical protein
VADVYAGPHAELRVDRVVGQPMIKRKFSETVSTTEETEQWISIEQTAEVEITSEDAAHPIEGAFEQRTSGGWRAETPGEQVIRLHFLEPRHVRHVRLVIEEQACERTQQFVLRASSLPEGAWRELVRQQFTFSPGGATREQEDYRFDLSNVSALELRITPDIRGGQARATLEQLKVA